MSMTLVDIMERLKHQPEIDLMELLEITSEDLVERFVDRIEEKFEQIEHDLEEEQDTLDD